MTRRYLTAPFVLLTVLLLLAVLFGPLATALEPLFEVFLNSESVQNSDVVGPGNLKAIEQVLFVQAPIVYVGAGVLFLILAALRLEGVLKWPTTTHCGRCSRSSRRGRRDRANCDSPTLRRWRSKHDWEHTEHRDRRIERRGRDAHPPGRAGPGLAGLGMGAVGALGTAEAVSANPQGELGNSADPLAGAFVEQLAGPISDTGNPITQLVNVRLEEAGTSVNPDPNTLVIFYNPWHSQAQPAPATTRSKKSRPTCSGWTAPTSTASWRSVSTAPASPRRSGSMAPARRRAFSTGRQKW